MTVNSKQPQPHHGHSRLWVVRNKGKSGEILPYLRGIFGIIYSMINYCAVCIETFHEKPDFTI